MKNLFFGMLTMSVMLFIACEQENILPNETTEFAQGIDSETAFNVEFSDIIAEMGGDKHGGKSCMKGDTISSDSLPQAALDYIADNYPNETIEVVVERHHGYGVELSDGTTLLFNDEGEFRKECNTSGGNGGGNNGGGKKKGCMKGDTISVDSLPQIVLDYVADNYPNETIETVVVRGNGYYGAELSDGTTLIFDADGNFVKECNSKGNGGGNGHGGGLISVDDLPAFVTDYIAENYPDEEVDKAYQKGSGEYFIKLSDGTKLVFDADGNLLYDSGN